MKAVLQTGFNRLVLINSGGYSFGMIPLDGALTIVGPNNVGKTTLINALQILLFTDQRSMRFQFDMEKSRMHYFPHDTSYVLAEVESPEGVFVFGAVGHGPARGYQYQYFLYRGHFVKDDYIEDGSAVDFNALVRRLVAGGRTNRVHKLTPGKMRDALIGTPTGNEDENDPRIGLLPLKIKSAENYASLLHLLSGMLHMNTPNEHSFKRLLVQLTLPKSGDRDRSLSDLIRKKTREYRNDREKLETLERITPFCDDLLRTLKQRESLSSVLNTLYPKIVKEYEKEIDGIDAAIAKLGKEQDSIEPRLEENRQAGEKNSRKQTEVQIRLNELNRWLKKLEEDRARFGLVEDRKQLVEQIRDLQARIDEVTMTLGDARPERVAELESQLSAARRQRDRLEAEINTVERGLAATLASQMDKRQIEALFKLANHDLIGYVPISGDDAGLTVNDRDLFQTHIERILRHIEWDGDRGYYDDGNVRIDLSRIPTTNVEEFLDVDAKKARLSELEQSIADLEARIGQARRHHELKTEKENLESERRKQEEFLAAYDDWKARETLLDEKTLERDAANSELESLVREHNEIAKQRDDLIDRKHRIENDRIELERRKGQLEQLRRQITPLEDLQSGSMISGKAIPEHLEDQMELYIQTYQDYKNNKNEIDSIIRQIESMNGLGFITRNGSVEDIRTVAEVRESLEENRKALIPKLEHPLKEISGHVSVLLGHLGIIEERVSSLNKALRKTPISNLTNVSIQMDKDNRWIQLLVDLTGHEEGFSLLSSQDKVIGKFEELIEHVTEKGFEITLENLFSLYITIESRQGKTRYRIGDRIESTGTDITIRMVLLGLLLRELLEDRAQTRLPVYIDESSRIDIKNQHVIVEQCKKIGLVPILASTRADLVLDYWVPVVQDENGRSFVSDEQWVRGERMQEEQDPKASSPAPVAQPQ